MTSAVLSIRHNSPADLTRSAPVVMLDGSGHSTAEVGGKVSSLDVLIKEGFPVPASRTRLGGGVGSGTQLSEASNARA